MPQQQAKHPVELPPIVFGTSALGNLYTALDERIKQEIVEQCVRCSPGRVVFDSAGKYGAGLALESLGNALRALRVPPDQVVISNKLGWYRTELKTAEPSFEPGVWKDLRHAAVQKISYAGIVDCFEQGNMLLGGYVPGMVSVHDPDEYLAGARDSGEAEKRYRDVLGAYRALDELKAAGKVSAIGVGAKDWRVIRRIAADTPLDWVMIANSMTIKNHPEELCRFMNELKDRGISIVNSAVFHSGFLTGSDHYDYRLVREDNEQDAGLFRWRKTFFNLCAAFGISPAVACVQFALRAPGVKSIALNTSNPKRVKENIDMAYAQVPAEFWTRMQRDGLIRPDYLV